MLISSYAWASGNPWYVMLPLDAPVLRSLSVMIIGIPWYLFQFILSQLCISLLLSRTDNKMPYLVPILMTHPIQGNSHSQMDCLPSLAIYNLCSGVCNIVLTYFYCFLDMLGWTHRPGPDTIMLLHTLKLGTQIHVRTPDWSGFQWHTPIQFIHKFVWVMMDLQDVIHIK